MARSIGVTREQVIAVAAALADEHGLDNLTLAQVAGRLGIRLPSLYNHIDGLADLRRQLALHGMRQLLDRLRRATVGKSGDDAVMALGLAYRGYVIEHPGVYATLIGAPAADDLEAQQISGEIIEVVLSVLAFYRLDQSAGIHAVRGLRSIVHGYATIEAGHGFEMPVDREQSFRWLLHTFIAGLRTAAAESTG